MQERPSDLSIGPELRKPSREFDALLETIVGLAAANMVVIETLHEHRVLDRRHFAHAFGRVLDRLAPELRGGMVEHTLRDLRDRCMNVRADGLTDLQAWLERLHKGDHTGEHAGDHEGGHEPSP
jgi:hypothetical protein